MSKPCPKCKNSLTYYEGFNCQPGQGEYFCENEFCGEETTVNFYASDMSDYNEQMKEMLKAWDETFDLDLEPGTKARIDIWGKSTTEFKAVIFKNWDKYFCTGNVIGKRIWYAGRPVQPHKLFSLANPTQKTQASSQPKASAKPANSRLPRKLPIAPSVQAYRASGGLLGNPGPSASTSALRSSQTQEANHPRKYSTPRLRYDPVLDYFYLENTLE